MLARARDCIPATFSEATSTLIRFRKLSLLLGNAVKVVVHTGFFTAFSTVHTSTFSFENADLCIRFCFPSSLI